MARKMVALALGLATIASCGHALATDVEPSAWVGSVRCGQSVSDYSTSIMVWPSGDGETSVGYMFTYPPSYDLIHGPMFSTVRMSAAGELHELKTLRGELHGFGFQGQWYNDSEVYVGDVVSGFSTSCTQLVLDRVRDRKSLEALRSAMADPGQFEQETIANVDRIDRQGQDALGQLAIVGGVSWAWLNGWSTNSQTGGGGSRGSGGVSELYRQRAGSGAGHDASHPSYALPELGQYHGAGALRLPGMQP